MNALKRVKSASASTLKSFLFIGISGQKNLVLKTRALEKTFQHMGLSWQRKFTLVTVSLWLFFV